MSRARRHHKGFGDLDGLVTPPEMAAHDKVKSPTHGPVKPDHDDKKRRSNLFLRPTQVREPTSAIWKPKPSLRLLFDRRDIRVAETEMMCHLVHDDVAHQAV
jgi:hypothetical protein